MNRIPSFIRAAIVLATVQFALATISQAGTVLIPGGPCAQNEAGRGGVVVEHGPRGSQFDLFLTDFLGRRLNPQPAGYPQRLIGDANGNASFTVPRGIAGVCDAVNDTLLPPGGGGGGGGGGGAGGGARAVLMIESIYFDPTRGEFLLQNIFETIHFLLGDSSRVLIPDLYGDTNQDGTIDAADTLYSLVDLDGYIPAPPPGFAFGDAFNIVNGAAAGLPFMQFSTTPFVFDRSSGFTGTAYTGRAVVATSHDLFVPEPGTLALVASALALLALGGTRGRKQ